MYALLNNYTVLNMAQQLALSAAAGRTDVSDPRVGKAARNLVLTEDFFLSRSCSGTPRARSTVRRRELAVFVADKRITDYKRR